METVAAAQERGRGESQMKGSPRELGAPGQEDGQIRGSRAGGPHEGHTQGNPSGWSTRYAQIQQEDTQVCRGLGMICDGCVDDEAKNEVVSPN